MKDLVAYFSLVMCLHTTMQCHVQGLAECDSKFKVDQHSCDCQANREGQLKFENGQLFACTGSEWKALVYNEYGLKTRPGYSCEDIKANHGNQAANGIYWITLSHRKFAFPVYCDMAGGGWTMAFKAVAGVDKNVYDVYNSGETSSEDVMAALDVTNKHPDHYKNRIILKWRDFDASEARVALYRAGTLVEELKFNAKGTDNQNWFHNTKLTYSPWSDIHTEPKNFFSIHGAASDRRYFFINRHYDNCDDAGWLVVSAKNCDWEKHFTRINAILYSKGNNYIHWKYHEAVGEADVLVVYVR